MPIDRNYEFIIERDPVKISLSIKDLKVIRKAINSYMHYKDGEKDYIIDKLQHIAGGKNTKLNSQDVRLICAALYFYDGGNKIRNVLASQNCREICI